MKTKSKFSLHTLLLVAAALAYFVPAWNSKATTHIITFTYYSYSPNQLTVAVGDTIIWQGSFYYHPLRTVSIPVGADTIQNSTGSTYTYVVVVPGIYNYRCNVHGGYPYYMTGSFDALATGVGDNQISERPRLFRLDQNFPNPFNPTTSIRFSVPNASVVTLKVFDIIGNEVATLVNERKSPGNYVVDFNGANLASGIYLYRLEATNFSDTKKLLLLK